METQPMLKPVDGPNTDPFLAAIDVFREAVFKLMTPEEADRFEIIPRKERGQAMLEYTLENPERFKDALIDAALAFQTAGSTLFSLSLLGSLAIDGQGELVLITGHSSSVSILNIPRGMEPPMRSLGCTYRVLTGPEKGKNFKSMERPLLLSSDSAMGAIQE